MVELRGLEPLTPSLRTRCATGLRHSPKNLPKISTGSACAQGAVRQLSRLYSLTARRRGRYPAASS